IASCRRQLWRIRRDRQARPRRPLTGESPAATLAPGGRPMVMTEAWEGLQHDRNAVEAVIAALAAMVGNRLVTSQAVREQHGNTLTWIGNQPPDAVVFPQTTEDVQQI